MWLHSSMPANAGLFIKDDKQGNANCTATVTTSYTLQSADHNSHYIEETDEGKSLKSGFEAAMAWAATSLT
jgi:hypothetical protein